MKDCIKLAGGSNQRINQIRRMTFKPTIPSHLKSLSDKALETEKELFGDNLHEKLKTIKPDNKLKTELSKANPATFEKPIHFPKYTPCERRDKSTSSSSSENARPSQKSRGGHATGQSNNQGSFQSHQKHKHNKHKKSGR